MQDNQISFFFVVLVCYEK